MSEAKGVEAVEKAFKILECFTSGRTEMTLTEISEETGFYKSTVLRLAVSLEKFGYMIRGEDNRFRLGAAAWRLGSSYRQSFALGEIIRPELKILSEATNETASFYVREGNVRICLFRSEPARAIRHSIAEGRTLPLNQGASGKVLHAFSNESGDAAIRAAGHSISLGERDGEVAAVSVPILAAGGRLIGALSVSGLITRFGEDRRAELIHALNESRARLEPQLAS